MRTLSDVTRKYSVGVDFPVERPPTAKPPLAPLPIASSLKLITTPVSYTAKMVSPALFFTSNNGTLGLSDDACTDNLLMGVGVPTPIYLSVGKCTTESAAACKNCPPETAIHCEPVKK